MGRGTETGTDLESGEARSAAKPVRFIVLSTQRSGSTWVVDMLNSHPQVTCYGALFLPEGQGKQPVGAQMPYFYDLMRQEGRSRILHPVLGWRFVSSVFRNTRGGTAVGFKLMYSQFKYVPWLLLYLTLRRVRVVHLVRSNKLDHVISTASARARGQFHQWDGEQVENPPVRLEPERVVDQIRWEETKVRRARRILALLRAPRLEITYEELVQDPSRYDDVLTFIGAPTSEGQLTTSLRKWNRRGYEASVENLDELRAALRGTPYAALLDRP